MKLFLFLWFNLALLCINKVSSKLLNEHDIVGVNSKKKIDDLLKKAISGFRNIMRTGNEPLGIPILDPYKIDNFSWTYEDEDLGTKLDLIITAPATLRGLSNFITTFLSMNIEDLRIGYSIILKNLELEIPYKIEGVIKNIIPIYGQGIAKMKTTRAYINGAISVSLKNSHIVLNNVFDEYSYITEMKLDISDLMDLPSSFSNDMLKDIFWNFLRYEYTTKFNEEFVKNLFQKYVAGKTIDEVTEFLKFCANKAE